MNKRTTPRVCPKCLGEKTSLINDRFESDTTLIYEMKCLECGEKFKDVFQLVYVGKEHKGGFEEQQATMIQLVESESQDIEGEFLAINNTQDEIDRAIDLAYKHRNLGVFGYDKDEEVEEELPEEYDGCFCDYDYFVETFNNELNIVNYLPRHNIIRVEF